MAGLSIFSNSMKVLIFHQYFSLPTQAGSSRIYYFVKGLEKNNKKIVVITGSRCRKGFLRSEYISLEKRLIFWKYKLTENISIISIQDYYSQHLSFKKRIASFLIFATLGAVFSIFISGVNVVFASSTPLTITIPAILISKLKRVPFVLEIRDLWPDAPIQLGLIKNKLFIALAYLLEMRAYKNAKELIGLSRGICRKIEDKTGCKVYFVPNGVDDIFFMKSEKRKRRKTIQVIYSGSCGFNNAIEIIFKVAELFEKNIRYENKIEFVLLGDGPALDDLRKNTPKNLSLVGKVSKIDVVRYLTNADIAFFSQRKVNSDLKKDSLPNKFFDFIGASLPVVAGVEYGGELWELITSNNCGIAVEPEDIEGLENALIRVIENTELRSRMSASSKKLAEYYRREDHVRKFISLIENAVVSK